MEGVLARGAAVIPRRLFNDFAIIPAENTLSSTKMLFRSGVLAVVTVLCLSVACRAAVPVWFSAVAGSANGGGCKVVAGKIPTAGAWAYFTNTMNSTGWAKLNVITNPNGFSDADQAYLAGCVEGMFIILRKV
jgi:hypothetical protein